MDWTILGIAPTDDKKAITAAYRAKLKTTNPEEKPEEFKALRAAYEEALRLADQVETPPTRDESPVGLWMERVAAVYNDYPSRIDPDCWRALLSDDVCAGLDTRPNAEEALMQFLMENYYLPRTVWQVLDEAFSLMERSEELCEAYPRDFIEHCVLNGIRFEQNLRFELFIPGKDAAACDAYRRLYYQCTQTPPDQRTDLLERMESLPEQHPYGEALRCRWLLDMGREEEGRAGFRSLAERYPDDANLSMDHASLCVQSGEFDEAEEISRHILSLTPTHVFAMRTLAECQAEKGDLADAKETLFDVMNVSGDDPVLMDQLAERIRTWNTELIARYEAALSENSDDTSSAMELAWCHLQCERPDSAMEVALTIDPDRAEPFIYHNLMGKLYHSIEMYEESGEHIARVIDILRTMEPDGTAKTEKRIRRLPEMLQILGSCMMQTGRADEARSVFTEALSLAPYDPKVLSVMANIHYSAGEYEDCVDVLHRLTQVSPGGWYGHMMLSLCLCKLRRDPEAFESINRALSLRGGDLSLYVMKMQILLRNGVFEEVRSILDFLREHGAPEEIGVDFIRAQLLELEDKDEQAAFRSYQAIARRVEDGENLLDAPLLYYRMANIMGRKTSKNRKEDREILLATLEKGLQHDPHDPDCLDYKAWLLRRNGRMDEAIEMYKNLSMPNARRKLADLYYSDLNHYAADALALYEELLREHQTSELCFYAAVCALRLGDLAKTERYSLLELELEPDDIDAHNNLAFVRESENAHAEALEHMDKAAATMWQNGQFYDWLLEHRIKLLRRLGRHADALAAIDEAMSKSDYENYELKFEICCQFGLWDQAEAVLAQWAKASRNDPEVTKSTGLLHLYRGKLLKATFAYGKVKNRMDPDEETDLRIQLADLEANAKRLVQLWRSKLENDGDRVNVLMNLALALYWAGDAAQAKACALKGLELVDETLRSYNTSETLHRTRRSLLLALAGREEEARAELALARTKPLCRHCSYGSCKDADIFEAFLEELAGNYAKAKALYQAGKQNWPDELDFHSGETRMKKKKG